MAAYRSPAVTKYIKGLLAVVGIGSCVLTVYGLVFFIHRFVHTAYILVGFFLLLILLSNVLAQLSRVWVTL